MQNSQYIRLLVRLARNRDYMAIMKYVGASKASHNMLLSHLYLCANRRDDAGIKSCIEGMITPSLLGKHMLAKRMCARHHIHEIGTLSALPNDALNMIVTLINKEEDVINITSTRKKIMF